MKISAPKGTRDILPQDSYKWQYIEKIMREVCRTYGFREVRTPMFEQTELFLRGVGDTTDVVQKEMYTFTDKGNRSMTLRPEGTAGVARAFVEHGLASEPLPVKFYYLAHSVFRYENPQAGRLREHHQFGVEVFGAMDATADAEVISLAFSVLKELGVNDLQLNINSIGCGACRPSYNKRLVEYLESSAGELCDTCKERLTKNPLRVLDCKEEKCKQITANAPVILDGLCEECSAHFEMLKSYLDVAGIKYHINPFIVRGLDYYTKTVFEIISNTIGSQGTVCGGGRYDGLIKEVGGPPTCGVGFGMGMERLLMVMNELPEMENPKLFLCTSGMEARNYAFLLLTKLREQGIWVDMDHANRSMKAQFKYADKLGAEFCLAIGDSELESREASLRNMKSGVEIKVSLDDLTLLKGGLEA